MQDVEERALALAVLGSAGSKKTRADRRAQRKSRRDEGRAEQRAERVGDEQGMQDAILKATGKQFEGAQPDAEDLSSSDSSASEPEAEAGSNARPKQAEQGGSGGKHADGEHAARSSAGDDVDAGADAALLPSDACERAEVAALLAEENVAEVAEEDRDKLTVRAGRQGP